MQRIKVGLIGCGKIAEKHVKSLKQLESDVEIVALCDISKEQIEHLINKLGLTEHKIAKETNIERLLQREMDLVVIATSTDSHLPLARQALQANKHVLVEKPLALAAAEARAIVKEADQCQRILAVSLQTRYLSQIQAVKKALDHQWFGKLLYGTVKVRWHRDADYYQSSRWRGTWEKDGGVLLNQCIHYIDLLQWMAGPVQAVYGLGDTFVQPMEAEDVGLGLLTFTSGAFGIIEGTTAIHDRNSETSLELIGEHGRVSLEGARLNKLTQWSFHDKQRTAEWQSIPIDAISHTPLYKDLVQAIRTGSKPLVSADASLPSLETILALYQSMGENRPVALPLDNFSTKEMANKRLR
ncbi:Predicted dehydrogenase [Evansella caseinilytica]|uniref:Predicted dehydrogenase n=1 Tax=Evansella caseinilytica TaxID=1503961 RepID=A0A1H3HMA7_9BACI|nr:Gfo/Idh/MocA family oxidoreductase [Evansella caseinilytica]SDY16631.1 Predicted dehydrogenase [Evansella caseinilytica]